jgi:hypothetical protein
VARESRRAIKKPEAIPSRRIDPVSIDNPVNRILSKDRTSLLVLEKLRDGNQIKRAQLRAVFDIGQGECGGPTIWPRNRLCPRT